MFALGFPFLSLPPFSSWLQCTMTKRDSLIAGITSSSAPMSMPRRHSRYQDQSHSDATSYGSRPQPSSITDNWASPSFSGTDHSGSLSHHGYMAPVQPVPLPTSSAHQTPIQPTLEEAYPLQAQIQQRHRTLHTHIFTEVRSPQTGVSSLMVTEVDRYGVQPCLEKE